MIFVIGSKHSQVQYGHQTGKEYILNEMLGKKVIKFPSQAVPEFRTIYQELRDAIQAEIPFSEKESGYNLIDPVAEGVIIMIIETDQIKLLLVGRIMDFTTGVLLRILQEFGGVLTEELPSFANMTLQEFTENEDLDQWIRRWTLEEDDGVW